MRSEYQTAQQGSSDATGNITFKFPAPGAGNLTVVATFAILEAGAGGQMVASVDSTNKWGPWSGSQPFGPITFTANATMQIVCVGLLPGTVYTCQLIGWTDDEPVDPSTPTPTGTTALFGADTMVDLLAQGLNNGAGVTFGGFPCTSWAGLRLACNVSQGGPLTIRANWFNQARDFVMASRFFTMGGATIPAAGPGQFLQSCFPHLGDSLDLVLSNTSGGLVVFTISATHSSQPVGAWGGMDFMTGTATVAHGGTGVLLQPQFLYGGPAQLEWSVGSFTAYLLQFQYMDAAGAWHTFWSRDQTSPARESYRIMLPAAPLQLIITNNAGAGSAAPEYCALELDVSRVG